MASSVKPSKRNKKGKNAKRARTSIESELATNHAIAQMASTTSLRMKLLIDRKAQRVLFAEASKEVVDFLFSLLALPVATTVKLVGKGAMVGCVGNLYTSVEKLDPTYVQPGAAKKSLLRPAVLSQAGTANCSLLRLPAQPSSNKTKSFYKCGNCFNYVTDVSGTKCPSCANQMTTPMKYASPAKKAFYKCGYNYGGKCQSYVTDVSGTNCPSCANQMTTAMKYASPASSSSGKQVQNVPTGGAKGFVQGIVTYTVQDNLTVTPMSTISSITLLSTFAVKNLGDLQEKTVQLGYNEGLAILKASLQSKTVLTDVFLAN